VIEVEKNIEVEESGGRGKRKEERGKRAFLWVVIAFTL
jgi:hypothetical protein